MDQVCGKVVNVAFGNIAVRYFIKHVLFHNLNYQQYISATRNLGPLLACIGTLFEWALQELSTGVFLDSSFDLSPARRSFDKKMLEVYTALPSDVRDALVADIYTRGGQSS
jgi:hypothetical protein